MRRARGFTLIELLIVVALIAVASSVVTLALRDPAATQLEREAVRLASLLESARAESRALGLPVTWLPRPSLQGGQRRDFSFEGLPARVSPPTRWLQPDVHAEVVGATPARPGLQLGPEPWIGAQRIVLRLEGQQVVLATDGLGPFEIETAAAGEGAADGS
ncbi:MAG: pilus assembly FimT family protein [Pseudomonadota bacterium]